MNSKAIRKALYKRLTEDAELTALLATPTSVFDEQAPQGSQRPYVVFSRPSSVKTARTFGGGVASNEIWQIKAVDASGSASKAEDIAARIEALDDTELAIQDVGTLWFACESGLRFTEDDGPTTIWHIGSRFRLVTEPA